MKKLERSKAIDLRRNGHSLKEIALKLKVSKSSVSRWTQNIALTADQHKNLMSRSGSNRMKGALSNKKKWLKKRYLWQQEGKLLARQNSNNPLFVSGCMLYWGEGRKNRNQIEICNSDPELLKYFIKFLKKFFPASSSKLKAAINCYLDVYSYQDILNYWSQFLNIEKCNFNKPQINNVPISSKQKRKKILPYGTCKIGINSVKEKQILLGAIQEIGGFVKKEWYQ